MITGTIVVRASSRVELLAQCLRTVDAQLVEPLEVLILHDGEDARRSARIIEWLDGDGRRRELVAPRPGGAAAGNLALEAARTDVVLFVDATCLLPPTAVRSHLTVHEALDRAGVVGGPVGVHWPAGRPPGLREPTVPHTSGLDLGDDTGPFPDDLEPVRANTSVRRAAALAVGGFDPWLDVGEPNPLAADTFGLSVRLGAAGWRTVYDPAAAVIVQVEPADMDAARRPRRVIAAGVERARREQARTGSSRTRRARRAAGELRAAGRSWRARRGGQQGSSLPVLLHAGAGLEFARLVVTSPPCAGGLLSPPPAVAPT